MSNDPRTQPKHPTPQDLVELRQDLQHEMAEMEKAIFVKLTTLEHNLSAETESRVRQFVEVYNVLEKHAGLINQAAQVLDRLSRIAT